MDVLPNRSTLLESKDLARGKEKAHLESESRQAPLERQSPEPQPPGINEERLTQLIRSVEARLSKQLVALGAPALPESEYRRAAVQGASTQGAEYDFPRDVCNLEDVGIGPVQSMRSLMGRADSMEKVDGRVKDELPSLRTVQSICSLVGGADSMVGGDEKSYGRDKDELPLFRKQIDHIMNEEKTIVINARSSSKLRRSSRSSVGASGKVSLSWLERTAERADFCKRFVLTPKSPYRIVFDLLSVLTVLYDSTVRPFLLAWDANEDDATTVLSMYSLLFWTCDLMLNFITGFYSKSGELQMGLLSIGKNYLRGWFPIDFSLIMLDWLGVIFDTRSETRKLSALGRLARTARIIRVFKVVALIKHFSKGIISPRYKGLFQALQILAVIVWVNHLISCMWMGAARIGGDVFNQTWLDRFDGGPLGHAFSEASVAYQYTTALHWSITQMTPGSMEVFPTNPLERTINILCLIFGLFFGSTLISQLSAGLVQLNMARREERMRMDKLRRYLKENSVPLAMATIIQGQVTSRLSHEPPLIEKDVHALQLLPSALRLQLQAEVFSTFLMRHPLFLQAFGQDSTKVKELLRLNAIERVILSSGDELFCVDSPAEYVYLVLDGTLQYTNEEQEPLCHVELGTWMCEAALWLQWVHVGTMTATTPTEILKMYVPATAERLYRNSADPRYRANIQTWVRAFMSSAASLQSDGGMYCLDAGISLPSIMMALSQDARATIGNITLDTCCDQTGVEIVKLKEELDKGKCVLMQEGSGRLLRLVYVAAIKLSRQKDNLIFTQIGRKNSDNVLVPCVVLPGRKLRAKEDPHDAILDLLQKDLKGVESLVCIGDCENCTEMRDSDSYQIRTSYHRIEFHAHLREDTEFDSMVSHSQMQIGKATIETVSLPVDDEEDCAALYAWLSPSQILAFQKDDVSVQAALKPRQSPGRHMSCLRRFRAVQL
eukprot:TRINITY_DN8885_c0_g1_i1.p1 TRINITY_DN8885_c0_g1~~TRINITY_DN8885_c0_g1_i1.p1  ORF type:complete len:964 (-),score=128.94 TRINITY_DN8885_c0_g1_i1:65-2911(-)